MAIDVQPNKCGVQPFTRAARVNGPCHPTKIQPPAAVVECGSSVSIDAVALLRIANLRAPRTALGAELFVGLSLRRLLGTERDAHDDPRGVLFFPDVGAEFAAAFDASVRRDVEREQAARSR